MGLCPTLWVGEFTRFKDKERENMPFLGLWFQLIPGCSFAHDCNDQIFQRRAILPKLRLHKGSVAQPLITTFGAFPLGLKYPTARGGFQIKHPLTNPKGIALND